MPDIFGNNVQAGGAWKLDGAVITLAEGFPDLLVNQCQIQYQRAINKINPINTSKQYMVAGRGSGSATLGMIVGPSKGIKQFLTFYSDVCEIGKHSLSIKAASVDDCENKTFGSDVEFLCKYCLLQSINASVQAGDLALVNAGTTLIIGSLELK